MLALQDSGSEPVRKPRLKHNTMMATPDAHDRPYSPDQWSHHSSQCFALGRVSSECWPIDTSYIHCSFESAAKKSTAVKNRDIMA